MAYPTYYNPYQVYQPQQQVVQQPPQQIQQKYDFIPVPSEEVARNYPVAAGNSVNFKDENAPYIYIKSMGMSPLGQPVFEKYKLTKEEDEPLKASNLLQNDKKEDNMINNTLNDLKLKIGALEELTEDLKNEIDILKTKKNATKKKDDN